MPRAARIDIPGMLNHVIVRGIERRDIFIDDEDRSAFLERLSSLLEKTGTTCLAWALIPNHFHLLLRTSEVRLSTFMRRLLTGYAVVFNLRHNRCGHLFQNRYKSIVCQEDSYLLELVRYIHLNPLRAHVVSSLDSLCRYRWSGHAVVTGRQEMKGQDIDSVLALFGSTRAKAVQEYQEFIADGIDHGDRPDLVGRIAGQKVAADPFDSRVLGDLDFAEEVRAQQVTVDGLQARTAIAVIAEHCADVYSVPVRSLSSGGRRETVLKARSMMCFLALEEGHLVAEVARVLGMSRNGVVMAARRHVERSTLSDYDNSAI